jgi:hypothetical protein
MPANAVRRPSFTSHASLRSDLWTYRVGSHARKAIPAAMGKSFLLLFFKKEALRFLPYEADDARDYNLFW